MENMYVMWGVIPVLFLTLALAGLLYYFGTSFRISKNGISFGLKKYSRSNLSEYDFVVSQQNYQSHDNQTRFVKNRGKMALGKAGVPIVKVEVYHNGALLRTHIFTVSNEQAAQNLILKINQGIENSRTQ